MTSAVIVIYQDDVIRFANRRISELLKLPKEVIIGKNITGSFTTVTLTHFLPIYQRTKETLTAQYANGLPISIGDQTTIMAGWLVPLIEEGVYGGMIVCFDDVTEQKRAENALRESEINLRAVLDGGEQSFLYLNPDTTIRLFNQSAQKKAPFVFGKELSLGQPVEKFLRDQDRALFQQNFRRAMAGETIHVDKHFHAASGRDVYYELVYYPVRDENGTVQGVCVTGNDITPRKQSEEALRKSRERLQMLFEQMPVMIIAFDSQNRVLAWNREAQHVTGYTAEEVLGMDTIDELCYPDPEYRRKMQALEEATGRMYRNAEWTLTRKDGEKRTVAFTNLSSILPVPGWHTWSIGIDVTERKEAERAVERKADQLDHLYRLLQRLSQIGVELQKETDQERLLGNLGKRMSESAMECIIALRQPDQPLLAVRHLSIEQQQSGEPRPLPPGLKGIPLMSLYECPYYYETFEQKQPVFVTDLEKLMMNLASISSRGMKAHDFSESYAAATGQPYMPGAWAALPLMEQEHVMGVLWLGRDDLNESDLPALNIFASHVAVALQNARLHAELELRAETDGLTGLFNHRHLLELGQEALEQSRLLEKPLSVIMLDLDFFKSINDRFGHDTGDAVLREVSQLCRSCIRDGDIIGRYGGEELLIFLSNTALGAARMVAERIRQEIAAWVWCGDYGEVRLTASLGVAQLDNKHDDLKSLVQHSDQALYRAKNGGRNRVEEAV